MSAVEICSGVYWVGAIDWNVRNFHGYTYSTKRGTTYNSYLIMDDNITLVDAVYKPFTEELIENIKGIVDLEKINYVVVNHVEPDHTGALLELLELCPKAKVVCNAKCRDGLNKYYYGNWDFHIVKTGDKLKLGKKTLTFLEAPMIHWPDSMFTYCKEEELLMPSDAFGQHLATSERFDDEIDESILMDEVAKYYANILWPFGSLILRKIEEVQKLSIPIKIIAPSHGIIWRKEPSKVINKYISFAKNETKPKVVIVYETMWNATANMAIKISQAIADQGLSVKLFDINKADRTDVITEMLDAKGFIIGSSTHDMDMLPNLAGFLEFLKGLKPINRVGACFGSFGWSGGAVAHIERFFKEMNVAIVEPSVVVKYMPDEDELKKCYEFGRNFTKNIKI